MSIFGKKIEIEIEDTLGVLLVGLIVASTLQGVTMLQTFFYYVTYPKDRISLKYLVAVVCICDTLSLALISHAVYTTLVLGFSNPAALVNSVWSADAEPVISSTIALIVHIFLSYRIYALNNRWRNYAIILGLFSLVPYSMALASAGIIFTGPSLQYTDLRNELAAILIVANASSSAQDVLIALTIIYQLYTSRTGFGKTERMVNLLILYTINTGLLTTINALLDMITYLALPNTLICQIFTWSVSKVYTNTLLAMLNSRQSVRGAAFGNTVSTGNGSTMPPILFKSDPSSARTEIEDDAVGYRLSKIGRLDESPRRVDADQHTHGHAY